MANTHKSKKRKYVIIAVAVVLLATVAFVITKSKNSGDKDALPSVNVQRGTIMEKALAVGTIEPENRIIRKIACERSGQKIIRRCRCIRSRG